MPCLGSADAIDPNILPKNRVTAAKLVLRVICATSLFVCSIFPYFLRL